jgi:hypothetical protein
LNIVFTIFTQPTKVLRILSIAGTPSDLSTLVAAVAASSSSSSSVPSSSSSSSSSSPPSSTQDTQTAEGSHSQEAKEGEESKTEKQEQSEFTFGLEHLSLADTVRAPSNPTVEDRALDQTPPASATDEQNENGTTALCTAHYRALVSRCCALVGLCAPDCFADATDGIGGESSSGCCTLSVDNPTGCASFSRQALKLSYRALARTVHPDSEPCACCLAACDGSEQQAAALVKAPAAAAASAGKGSPEGELCITVADAAAAYAHIRRAYAILTQYCDFFNL